MEASKRIGPGESANSTRARNKATTCNSTLFREIVSILAIGAMTGVMFWQSVFGMVDSFTSGPVVEIVGSMAMEAQDYGR